MKIKTRGSAAALERYIKMAHYEKIPYAVDVDYDEEKERSSYIFTLDADMDTFMAAVNKYNYKDYTIIE